MNILKSFLRRYRDYKMSNRLIEKRFILLFLLIVFIFQISTFSQEIKIKGSVICKEQGRSDLERNAKNIIVYPEKLIEFVLMVNEDGNFEIKMPLKKILDRNLTFFYIGKTDVIEKKTMLISRDKIWRGEFELGRIVVKQICEDFDADYFSAQERIDSLKNRTLDVSDLKLIASVAVDNGPGILQALLTIAQVATAATSEQEGSVTKETIDIDEGELTPKLKKDGRFLERAHLEFSQNIGFSLTPSRNLNEAVFWNPSAILLATNSQMSFLSDYNRFIRFSTSLKVNQKFGIGFGMFYIHQEEQRTFRIGTYSTTENLSTNEFLVVSSLVSQISDSIIFALAPKGIFQWVEYPYAVEKVTEIKDGQKINTSLSFLTKNLTLKKVDFDISSTILPSPNFRVGFSLQNILGSRIRVDEYEFRNYRSFGVGVAFQKSRLNLGTELRITEKFTTYFAFGANIVPFNDALISFGISPKNETFSFGLNYRNLFYNFCTNEQRGNYHLLGSRIRF